jgi:hypothetical protein
VTHPPGPGYPGPGHPGPGNPPSGNPYPGHPGAGYPAPGQPGGYPAPGQPGGYPAPGQPGGYPTPGGPGPGYPGPGAGQYAPGAGIPPQPGPGNPAGFPGPAGPPAPKQHRSYTTLLLVGGAVVVVLIAVVVGVGVFVYRNTNKDTAPTGFTPTSSGQPIYHNFPPCNGMPKSLLANLIPQTEEEISINDPGTESNGPHADCRWDSPARNVDRTLDVTLWGYPDHVQTGVAGARGEYDSVHKAATQDSGKTEKDHTYGPPEDVPNLGLKAFAQYDDIRSSFHYGGTGVTVLLDNVLIEVTYNGSDGPDGQEKPMDKAKSRDGALSVAQEVVKLLSACPDCKS